MGIYDLKARLHDVPGVESLTMQMIAGRQNYNIGGKVVALDAAASDVEVEMAIRAAMTSDAIAQIPAGTPVGGPASAGADNVPPQAGEASPVSGTSPAPITAASTEGTEGAAEVMAAPSPSAALLPPVNATAPTSAPSSLGSAPVSVTGAKFAGLNLKQELQSVRNAMAVNSAKMAEAIAEMKDAASVHGQLAETIKSEAAALKADMAEFTNGNAD